MELGGGGGGGGGGGACRGGSRIYKRGEGLTQGINLLDGGGGGLGHAPQEFFEK